MKYRFCVVIEKGCCVLLKVKWYKNGANIALSIRRKGAKDFVDLSTENLTTNVNSTF